jgi:hypothetical protein
MERNRANSAGNKSLRLADSFWIGLFQNWLWGLVYVDLPVVKRSARRKTAALAIIKPHTIHVLLSVRT